MRKRGKHSKMYIKGVANGSRVEGRRDTKGGKRDELSYEIQHMDATNTDSTFKCPQQKDQIENYFSCSCTIFK